MKFLIIMVNSSIPSGNLEETQAFREPDYTHYTVEADNIEEAVISVYHNGFHSIVGIIRLPAEEGEA